MKRFLLLFIITSFAFATTINVPADSTTIQGGINGASTGDTVLVAAGTYMENIIFPGTNIVVMSSQGADSTIIDGNQNGSVVTIHTSEDTTTVLSGFTITNGNSNNGGGIICGFNSSPTLKNLIIRNNSASGYGGGIYCQWESNPIVKNVIISNNNVANNNGGGGISAFGTSNGSSNPTLINVIITSNSGYGLDLYHSNSVIKNTVIYYNGSGSIFPSTTNSLNVSYSDIEGGHSGTGNINEPPLFCDLPEGNLSLAANSPCIGTGENGTNMGNLEIGCDSIFTSLLINEIMQNPYAVSDENGEWFEIYNDGEAPINLEGWIIADKDDDTTVIAESYLSHPGSYSIIGIDANESVN
ncbi:MAG: lamin tail domain-containing protein, partial [Candidatus Marinimicrobia bacterium]|nr:lamin tail domain-containing protein [Candidatus Neomarinimicrobiota bacterium]